MRDLKLNLLRHHQRESLQHDITQSESMLAHAKHEDKALIAASVMRTKKQLESQSPVPLTGKEKDSLSALEKKLRTRITTNMPTEEVMRKNPAGAVDWHMRWEKANKPLIKMWKNVRIQLQPDNPDRDLANIERYRPSGQMDRMRSDAQIPGVMSYHNVAEEDWPFTPPQNTAALQAQRVYDDSEAESDVNKALAACDKDEAAQATDDPDAVPKISVEERAELLCRLAKGRAVLAEKRAAEKHLQEQFDAVPVTVTD